MGFSPTSALYLRLDMLLCVAWPKFDSHDNNRVRSARHKALSKSLDGHAELPPKDQGRILVIFNVCDERAMSIPGDACRATTVKTTHQAVRSSAMTAIDGEYFVLVPQICGLCLLCVYGR